MNIAPKSHKRKSGPSARRRTPETYPMSSAYHWGWHTRDVIDMVHDLLGIDREAAAGVVREWINAGKNFVDELCALAILTDPDPD